MSKKKIVSSSPSDQTQDKTEATSAPEIAGRAARQARPAALLALALAIAAIGISVWLWIGQVGVDPEMLAGTDELAEHDSRLAEIERRLVSLFERADGLDARFEELDIDTAGIRQQLDEAARDVRVDVETRVSALEAQLGQAVERLEQATGEQRDVDQALEHRLYLIEASALLRMAQERAELARDFSGAREAYRRASRLLRQADDPRLNRARGLLAEELESLEQVAEPDWLVLSGRLSQIAYGASEWPGAGAGQNGVPAEADDGEGWWRSVRQSLAALVRVQSRDELPVSSEQIDAAREQVRLRLLAAELAVARRDSAELAHHAAHARTVIGHWFDADSAAVGRALEHLQQLGETQAVQLPALGAALAELNRQLEDS